MEKSCMNCKMFTVCKCRIEADESTKGFVDFDKVGGSNWLGRFWKLLAERCIHHKSK